MNAGLHHATVGPLTGINPIHKTEDFLKEFRPPDPNHPPEIQIPSRRAHALTHDALTNHGRSQTPLPRRARNHQPHSLLHHRTDHPGAALTIPARSQSPTALTHHRAALTSSHPARKHPPTQQVKGHSLSSLLPLSKTIPFPYHFLRLQPAHLSPSLLPPPSFTKVKGTITHLLLLYSLSFSHSPIHPFTHLPFTIYHLPPLSHLSPPLSPLSSLLPYLDEDEDEISKSKW